MVLSNAERQKRFRQRLKARAAGADLGEQAQAAVEGGFAAIWSVLARNADTIGGGPDTFPDLLAFQRYHANAPAEALREFEGWLDPEWESDMSDDERAAVERAAVIYRAALLKHLPAEKKPRRARRKDVC